jgi:phospholipid/cholesterol/gamma-HCH transport system substrate-binding protein
MEYFRPSVKVGGFILLALTLLVVAAIAVGDIGNWFSKKQHYTIFFQNASLLPAGARVSYAGYAVGTATAMTVREGAERAQQYPEYPIAITITVRSDVPIRENSRIEMKTNGMIGDRYIDILPGTGPRLPPGSTLLGSAGGLDGLLASFSGQDGGVQGLLAAVQTLLDASQPDSIPVMLSRVNHLLDTLPPVITTLTASGNDLLQQAQRELTQTSATASRMLQGIDATVAENRPGIQRLISEFNTTLAEAQHTLDTTQTLLETSKGDLATLLHSVHSLVAGVQENRQELAAHLQKVLTHLDEIIVQNDRNIYTTVENLRNTSQHLEAAAEVVRANPSVLLFGRRSDDDVSTVNTSDRSNHLLQDRGRVGRYDRLR